MPKENINPDHYGRPNGPPPILSQESSGTIYYYITTPGPSGIPENDFSHVIISFGPTGATPETITNTSPSAWNYSGLVLGTTYNIDITPYDTFGNAGNTISWVWQYDGVSVSIVPSAGVYDMPLEITLSSNKQDAVIYYTLDGSEPSSANISYWVDVTSDAYWIPLSWNVMEGYGTGRELVPEGTYTVGVGWQSSVAYDEVWLRPNPANFLYRPTKLKVTYTMDSPPDWSNFWTDINYKTGNQYPYVKANGTNLPGNISGQNITLPASAGIAKQCLAELDIYNGGPFVISKIEAVFDETTPFSPYDYCSVTVSADTYINITDSNGNNNGHSMTENGEPYVWSWGYLEPCNGWSGDITIEPIIGNNYGITFSSLLANPVMNYVHRVGLGNVVDITSELTHPNSQDWQYSFQFDDPEITHYDFIVSTSAAAIDWIDVTDPSNWQGDLPSDITWNGTSWDVTADAYGMLWNSWALPWSGYRPTKFRLTFTGNSGTVNMIDTTGYVNALTTNYSLVSGTEYNITLPGDMGRFVLQATSGGMNITKIEFF